MHGPRLRWFLVLSVSLACGDDEDGTGDTTTQSTGSGAEQSCPAGSDGCPCLPDDTCEALHICVQGTCEVDMESENGPSTLSVGSAEDSSETSAGTSDTGTSSSSDTGSPGCASSDECPRGEVCTAPAESPGVPAEPFACSRTCAGLGPDAAVCTDDASCCGAFCDGGSCLAP